MAPKKRLSDLLREEVKKPAEAGTPPAAEAQTRKKGSRSTGTASNVSRQKAQATQALTVAPSASEAPELEATPDSGAMVVDSIVELKAALEQAKTQETKLKQQIAKLEAELKEQAESTQQLQTQLQQATAHHHQLETELSEAKHTVLQLVEVNTELKQDLENLKARSLTQSTASPPPAKPRQEETKPARPTTPPLPPSALSQQEMLRRRQQESLAHPVFPAGPAPGHLSEKDLGWVD
jgi:chromosome segregation ATPase